MTQPDSPVSPVSHAAGILAQRRRSGEQGPRLPEWCRPHDIDTALAIQATVTDLLGERVAAWKCGLPAEGRVVAAPIYAGTVCTGAACAARSRAGRIRIEPELAFILARDLPPRSQPYTPAEVDAAIARTHIALELIGSRYSAPDEAGFAENLADGLLNQGLVIGPQVDSAAAQAAQHIALHVNAEGEQERRFDGRHPAGAPRAPLYWLAEFLRGEGHGLRAGQAVITGSYAGSFEVPAGRTLTVDYGGLGSLRLRFAPQ